MPYFIISKSVGRGTLKCLVQISMKLVQHLTFSASRTAYASLDRDVLC